MVVLKMVLLDKIGMVIPTSDHLLHMSAKFVQEGDILHLTVNSGVSMVQKPISIKS